MLALALTGVGVFAGPAIGQRDELVKLLPDDGAAGDRLGTSVAVSNNIAVVGAPRDNASGFRSGSACTFVAATGVQLAKLVPDDGAQDDVFGSSVAIGDGIAIIGAPLNDGLGASAGAAYLFDAATGIQLARLVPLDAETGDRFGVAVAMAGGLAVVGAWGDDDNGNLAGAAYSFDVSDPAHPVQLAKILPADGSAGEEFGRAIAVWNGLVVAGLWRDTDNGPESGSAYLFDARTGAQLAKFYPDPAGSADRFGTSVAIDTGLVLVGTPEPRSDNNGSAFLFDISDPAHPIQTARFRAPGHYAGEFGMAVALSVGLAVVGAPDDYGNGALPGSAYVFDLETGQRFAKLLPSDGVDEDRFGAAVSISEGLAVVGAPRDDDRGGDTGAGYTFDAARCPVDLTGDDDANTLDILAYFRLWAAGHSRADWDGDGDVDAADVGAFINDWAAGCP